MHVVLIRSFDLAVRSGGFVSDGSSGCSSLSCCRRRRTYRQAAKSQHVLRAVHRSDDLAVARNNLVRPALRRGGRREALGHEVLQASRLFMKSSPALRFSLNPAACA